jgi:hypothetical protein
VDDDCCGECDRSCDGGCEMDAGSGRLAWWRRRTVSLFGVPKAMKCVRQLVDEISNMLMPSLDM